MGLPNRSTQTLMPTIPFAKAQAFGNDFVIVEREDLTWLGIVDDQIARFARQICDRKIGIGADGLEVLQSSTHADAEMHL